MTLSQALQPLVTLFRSRTFVTALLSALVAIIVGLVPQVAPYQEQIISVGVALVLIAAGGEVAQNVLATNNAGKVEAAKVQLQIVTAQVEMARVQAAKAA